MLDERISIPISVAADALHWLEVLADKNSDPQLMSTIEALAVRIDRWRQLERRFGGRKALERDNLDSGSPD